MMISSCEASLYIDHELAGAAHLGQCEICFFPLDFSEFLSRLDVLLLSSGVYEHLKHIIISTWKDVIIHHQICMNSSWARRPLCY
jgi:hypothetical protein